MTHCPTKRLFLLLSALFGCLTICQAQEVYFGQDARDVERVYHKKTVVPITVRFQRKFYSGNRASLTLAVTSLGSDVRVIDGNQSFPLDCGGRKSPCDLVKVFHLVIPASSGKTDPYIGSQVTLKLTGSVNGASFTPVSQVLNIKESASATYTLSDYLADDALRLGTIKSVTSKDNVLTIYGKDNDGQLVSRQVALSGEYYYQFTDWSVIGGKGYWASGPFSVTTLPLRVRDRISVSDSCCRARAQAGLTTPGINMNLISRRWNRYFSNGRRSIHQINFGLWASPSVIELDSNLTDGKITGDETVSQLFYSLAFSLSYTYNDFSFALIPYGWDFNTTTTGRHYVYEGQPWRGIGIAIKPSILAPLFNK